MPFDLTHENRRTLILWLGCLGVVGIFVPWPASLAVSEWIVTRVGEPLALTLAAFGAYAFWKLRRDLAGAARRHWPALLALAIVAGVIHRAEPLFMKVLWDEPIHASVAYGIHVEREVVQPVAMLHAPAPGADPSFDYLSVSFRAYGFSRLVAAFYDIFGADTRWVFRVNFFCGVGALWAAYFWCHRLCGRRVYALAAPLLLAGAPVFGVVMNSGAYDMLNLALLLALGFAMSRWCERRDEAGLLAVTALSAALAITRVESVVYFAFAMWATVSVLREGSLRSTVARWAIVMAPLLLLPDFALQKILNATPYNLHQGQLAEGAPLLSFGYLCANLWDTVKLMCGGSGFRAGSVTLTAIAVLGMVGVGVCFRNNPAGRRVWWTPLLFLVFAACLYALVMCSFWGGPAANPAMTRFVLPLFGILSATGVAGVCAGAARLKPGAGRLVGIALVLAASLQLAFGTLPFHRRAESRSAYSNAWSFNAIMESVGQNPDTRTLYIFKSTAPFIARGLPSINENLFVRDSGSLLTEATAGGFSEFFHIRLRTDRRLADTPGLPRELSTGWVESAIPGADGYVVERWRRVPEKK